MHPYTPTAGFYSVHSNVHLCMSIVPYIDDVCFPAGCEKAGHRLLHTLTQQIVTLAHLCHITKKDKNYTSRSDSV